MATIAPTIMVGGAATIVSVLTLGASDDFVFDSASGQIMVLNNVTAGILSVVIDGADGTIVQVDGLDPIDVSGGFTFDLAVAEVRAIKLGGIREYLQGSITITGADASEAFIVQS